MKFDDLRAVAHNMVASFSSGYSLLAGVYQVDVLLEAREGKDGFIDIDFLAGTSSDKLASGPLLGAIASFRDALPKLCAKHGLEASAFRQLRARFVSTGGQHRFLVTVEYHKGRLCTDEYVGASVAPNCSARRSWAS